MADGDLHLSSRRVGIAFQGMLQRYLKAAMELFPKGRCWRLGREVVAMRNVEGEEGASALKRPFGARPEAFQESFWCSSGAFSSASHQSFR